MLYDVIYIRLKRLKNTKKSHINFENIYIEDYKDYIEIYNFEN